MGDERIGAEVPTGREKGSTMLAELFAHLRRQWMGALALFLVLTGGVAYATHEVINSSDIVDNQVFPVDVRNDTLAGGGLAAPDLRPGSVRSSEVANGRLNDEDVGQGTFVNFQGNIGTVAAHDCVVRSITGVNAQGDHLLLTPGDDSVGQLIYSAIYSTANSSVGLLVCNTSGSDIDDETTHFNLLVIDAQ